MDQKELDSENEEVKEYSLQEAANKITSAQNNIYQEIAQAHKVFPIAFHAYSEYENDLGPYENENGDRLYPPFSPNFQLRHYLGTDKVGRDMIARVLYGYRLAMAFSLLLLFFDFVIGILVGCSMGYIGGKFDILFQRVIEIWKILRRLLI